MISTFLFLLSSYFNKKFLLQSPTSIGTQIDVYCVHSVVKITERLIYILISIIVLFYILLC